MDTNILPFNLTPAPVVLARTSAPIDLGEYNDSYVGWKIVVDLSTTLETNDIIALATDDSASLGARNHAIEMWLAANLLAWNFVDDDGAPLPQPRDGGTAHIRQELLEAISRAIASAIAPKKN